MRKRTLLSNNIIKPIEEANYADICFYDKDNDEKIIVSSENLSAELFPLTEYTPIGIVAVPSSHTDEQRLRIVSLAAMNCDTPDSGSVTVHRDITWGDYYHTVNNLQEKNQIPYLYSLTDDSVVLYNTGSISLASDYFSGNTNNPLNSLEGFYFYNDDSYRMCSPYKEDGSKEPRYFDTSNTGNVLADFDGKSNTEKILAEDNFYSTDWQTSTYIDNYAYNQYEHPAAQCTWRFHTEGTKQGDWYLPSIGELGYAYARINTINIVINMLNSQYSQILGLTFKNHGWYLSSTQYSMNNAVGLYVDQGKVDSVGKNVYASARAFLKI